MKIKVNCVSSAYDLKVIDFSYESFLVLGCLFFLIDVFVRLTVCNKEKAFVM